MALRRGEGVIPTVSPDQVAEVEFIVDTGADFDVFNKKRAQQFREYMRKLQNEVVFDTAGGERNSTEGLRLQVAWWDGPSDHLLLKDSPSLLCVGSRTQAGVYGFHMCRGKDYACFVSAPRRKIVVFPIRGNTPQYSYKWERNRTDANPCGLYSIGEKDFRELVGIWVNAAGQLVLDEPCLDPGEIVHKYPDDPMRRFVATASSTEARPD